MATKRLLITEVRAGDRVSATRSGFRTVADVSVSYDATGPSAVTVSFTDSRSCYEDWRSYPADMRVYVKGN